MTSPWLDHVLDALPAGPAVVLAGPLGEASTFDLQAVAARHGLMMVSVGGADPPPGSGLERVAAARLPLRGGEFTAIGYQCEGGEPPVALLLGDLTAKPVPVVVHVECVFGDVFGSLACECSLRLTATLELIVSAGEGVLIYLRAQQSELLRHLTDPATRPLTAEQRHLGNAVITDLGVQPLSS